MDGQVCGLGTVHPLLTLNFFSTWILPLHVVPCCVSMLKSKSSSSVMDGLQRRGRYICGVETNLYDLYAHIYIEFLYTLYILHTSDTLQPDGCKLSVLLTFHSKLLFVSVEFHRDHMTVTKLR